ncbi:MAG: acyloxyacyl hydrolase [Methyloligellaceae bacterium]
MPRILSCSAFLNYISKFSLSVILLLSATGHAAAGGQILRERQDTIFRIDEVRVGAFVHNVEPDNGGTEEGTDINLEMLFGKPSWSHPNKIINHFIRPRPHIGGNINTANSTSMFYFGLTWDHKITDKIFFESSFGGAVHDGPLDTPSDSYGCSLNFRESASLGLLLDKHWSLLITVDHMSNANLCSRNAGLTNAGARFGYKF